MNIHINTSTFITVYLMISVIYYFKAFRVHDVTTNKKIEFVLDCILSALWPISLMFDFSEWCNKFRKL